MGLVVDYKLPLSVVHKKPKSVKGTLAQWSKTTFGNIFQQTTTLEDVVKTAEIQLEIAPIKDNKAALSKTKANLKRYLHIGEKYWRKKMVMKWFKDRDRNTKFFHSYVK